MGHPGFVVLDSPLLAYKEPEPGKERSSEDEGISGSDLKRRFYEHLKTLAGNEQIFIVDHTEPPPNFVSTATHFTNNPAIPRCGLFPYLKKPDKA